MMKEMLGREVKECTHICILEVILRSLEDIN